MIMWIPSATTDSCCGMTSMRLVRRYLDIYISISISITILTIHCIIID
jgi:hypothetical protein